MQLENALSLWSYPVIPVNLGYSDGLPVDDQELATTIQTYRNAGVMSRHMALVWIHSDPKVVLQEERALDAETAATLPTGIADTAGHVHEDLPAGGEQEDDKPDDGAGAIDIAPADAPIQSPFILGPGQDPPLRNPNPTAPLGAWPLA